MTTVLTIDASKIVQSRHIAETRDARYASTRDAARRCLQ